MPGPSRWGAVGRFGIAPAPVLLRFVGLGALFSALGCGLVLDLGSTSGEPSIDGGAADTSTPALDGSDERDGSSEVGLCDDVDDDGDGLVDEGCGCDGDVACETGDPLRGTDCYPSADVSPSCGWRWEEVAAGDDHTCAINAIKEVRCFGQEDERLGGALDVSGSSLVDTTGVNIGPGTVTTRRLACGDSFCCVVDRDGQPWCWGIGEMFGLTVSSARPVQFPLAGNAAANDLSAGTGFACVADSDQAVQCWGLNSDLQQGSRMAGGQLPPGVVPFTGEVQAVGVGAAHGCAVSVDGVTCWGSNDSGQVGRPPPIPFAVPVVVSDVGPGSIVTLDGGGKHNCGVTDAGLVFCWGSPFDDLNSRTGPLYDTGGADMFDFAAIPLPLSVAIAVGTRHACAATAEGAYCWGVGDDGQLTGTVGNSTVPLLVPVARAATGVARTATRVAAGDRHSCAVFANGSLHCWGSNDVGQLGFTPSAGADLHEVARQPVTE